MRKLLAFLQLTLLAASAWARTITGTIQKPNRDPMANAIATFSLSQGGTS